MRSGFSLVELAIVLVILGLLTGGILTGQTLIRASELRAVTTEYQNFQAATQTFRDKYFALPGDMRNATRFWNRASTAATCITNSAAAVGTPGACDGDGNGVINATTASAAFGENFGYWRHLANAGLIEGTYAGTAVGGVDGASFGLNVPRSKLSNAGWGIFTAAMEAGVTNPFTVPEYGNGLSFGAAIANAEAVGPVLLPEEAWNIDTKIDDGLPIQGAVIGFPGTANTCTDATGPTVATANYRLTDTAQRCALIFSRLF